ncbi:MAG: XdhC family protein [Ferruginibacter sp.]
MKEIRDIIEACKKAKQAGKKVALATVVHVEGSSYRRPGARMLVTEDGELTGAISGGCLEGDALKKALLAINQQKNKLVTYNTLDEDDHSIGIQLGCNGIVYILYEPINFEIENHPVDLLEKTIRQAKPSVLVTLFSLDSKTSEQPGTCLLTTAKKYGNIYKELEQIIEQDIAAVLNNKTSLIKKYTLLNNDILTGFIELIKPAVELVIAGAGNDAFPLVQIASVLGWHITITDGRKTHANIQRFPEVKKILVGKPSEVVPQLEINEETVAVLMSHNYNYDLAMLEQLLKQPGSYIGMLGPKKKLEKMLDELEIKGVTITAADQEKIYGPVGLDIGAETAEEIALSIVSEIKAVLAKREGGMLRSKNGFIHDHEAVIETITIPIAQ